MAAPALRDLDGHDPYELLGISRSAGEREIVTAYRKHIRKVHPDLTSTGGQQAVLLGVARAILLDPLRRAEYDLTTGSPRTGTSVPSAWESEDVEAGLRSPGRRPTHIRRPRVPPPPAARTEGPSTFAVVSVAFGAISLATSIEPLSSVPFGVISISCAAPCLVYRRSTSEVRMAGAGIACSILGIVLGFVVAVAYLRLVS